MNQKKITFLYGWLIEILSERPDIIKNCKTINDIHQSLFECYSNDIQLALLQLKKAKERRSNENTY